MRRAVEEVKISRKDERPLNYAQLKRITRHLTPAEQQQLTDFAISTYNCIDYQDLIYRFDDYGSLLTALSTTTGNEHGLKETFVGRSDKIYQQMTTFLLESHCISNPDDLLRMPLEKRRELFEPLWIWSGVSRRQVEKYLHLPEGAGGQITDNQR